MLNKFLPKVVPFIR